jgi:hypothetical protein
VLALRLADAYIGHLAFPPSAAEREEIRHAFAREFFSGFTGPDNHLIGSKAAVAGFKAGQEFRRKSSQARVMKTMEEFGYIATEAEGTWVVDFEVSCFRPRSQPDQSWWLSVFGGTKDVLPKREEPSSGPVLFHVSGFLSPKGQYGHLGAYEHEFYATKVVCIKGG